MSRKYRVYGAVIAIFFMATVLFASPVLADQNSAQAAIDAAQNSLSSCLASVQRAEAAGANVDALTATLNDSADLLTEAQLAYASNDYNSAYTYATQSQSMLSGVTSQASELQQNAVNNRNQNITVLVLSVVTSVAILCVGVAAWLRLGDKGRKS